MYLKLKLPHRYSMERKNRNFKLIILRTGMKKVGLFQVMFLIFWRFLSWTRIRLQKRRKTNILLRSATYLFLSRNGLQCQSVHFSPKVQALKISRHKLN